MVARQLDAKLRAHLVTHNNVFKEAAVGNAASNRGGWRRGSLLFQRPLLCIFDRYSTVLLTFHSSTGLPLCAAAGTLSCQWECRQ